MDTEHFDDEALDRTFIRAQIGGKWGSYSIRQLVESDDGFEAFKAWFCQRLDAHLNEEDMPESKKNRTTYAINACRLVEFLTGPLVKITKEAMPDV